MRTERSAFTLVGGAVVTALALVGLLAPALAPFDPLAVAGPSLAAPSREHLLGTNDVGQDLLSQLIWGTRASLVVALPAASLAVAVGVLVGGLAGLLRGWVDVVAMRSVDLFLALPMLPLLILIAALTGPSRVTVIVVIALAAWPGIARVVRSQTLGLARRGHVQAARGFGAGPVYVLRRHLAPALGPEIAANLVFWAATALVLQAALAFLGLSDPTEVSWGAVLNRALDHEGIAFTDQWLWWVLPAGLAITLAAGGLAFVGVGLESRANPRVNRTR